MTQNFTELNRYFIAHTHDLDPEEAAVRSYYHSIFSSPHHITWETLLSKKRCVILGEPGSGKSWEIEAQSAKLKENGKFSFVISLEALVQKGLTDQFDSNQHDLLHRWKSGQETAHFFLDSRDEAAIIDHKGFEWAIRNFAKDLSDSIHRARIIISSRIISWRGLSDEDVLNRHLPMPLLDKKNTDDTETDSNTLPVYRLAPLDEQQAKTLANNLVNNADEFIQDVSKNHAWNFARRPLDVISLVKYWQTYGKLGSLAQIVDFNITQKLLESNERRYTIDPLTRGSSRRDAAALALSATLCKRFAFEHLSEHHLLTQQNTARINPHAVLPMRTGEQIKALQERPLFDPAAFGSVRFHHRDTLDYMASECLRFLKSKNLPFSKLRSLLIVNTHAQQVVPESRRAMAAWVARDQPELRQELLKHDPEILLYHGDPSCLTLDESVSLLHRLTQSTVDLNSKVSAAQLARIATSELAPTVNHLLLESKTPEHMRELLLKLISEARFTQSAPIALFIAKSKFEPRKLKLAAIRTLGKLACNTELSELANYLLAETQPPAIETAMAIRVLYPEHLTDWQLATILQKCTPTDKASNSWLSDSLEENLEELPLTRLMSLIRMLVRLSREKPWIAGDHGNGVTKLSKKHTWVYGPLTKAIYALLIHPDISVASPWEIATALDQLSRASNQHQSTRRPNLDRLSKLLTAHSEIRRKLHLIQARNYKNTNGVWPSSIIPLGSHRSLGNIDENDIQWLLSQINNSDDLEHAKSIFEISSSLLQYYSKHRKPFKVHFKRACKDNPELKSLYNKIFPRWTTLQLRRARFRLQQLRYSNYLYNTQTTIKNIYENTIVWIQIFRFWRKLREGFALGILINILNLMDQNNNPNRLEHFDIYLLKKKYGRIASSIIIKGFQNTWRLFCPDIPRQNTNAHYQYTQASLIGISLEIIDGLDVATLPDVDAKTAIIHGLYELNGFPQWFDSLVKSHQKIASDVFESQFSCEFNIEQDAQHPFGLIHDLFYYGASIRSIFAPRLKSLLAQNDPKNNIVLILSLRLLASPDLQLRPYLRDLSLIRTQQAYQNNDNTKLLIWLSLWIQLDALSATDFINNSLLPSLSNDHSDRLIIKLSSILRGERSFGLAIVDPDFKSPSALQQLIPLIYRHVRLEDDRQHSGVYTPDERDDAEIFRSSLLSFLLETQSADVYDTIIALKQMPELSPLKERLNELSLEKLRADADNEYWNAEDVAEFIEHFSNPPQSPKHLFDLILTHLSEIRDDWEQGDFSLAGTFAENTDEVIFQKAFAARLQDLSKEVYQVAREVEVFDKKMPDIRLFRTGIGMVTIEIKVANKWSYNQLANESLKAQLLEKYMRYRRSRHGILLLVNLKKNKQWKPNPKIVLNFPGLINQLNFEARRIIRNRDRMEMVEVIGVDLS